MRTSLFTLLILLGLTPVFARAENWDRFRGPNGLGIATDKSIPVSFDDKTNVVWKLALPGLGNSSPVIWGKHLFLQTASADGAQRVLQCIDVTQGKELWSRGIPGAKVKVHDKNTLASSTPVTDGEAVFVSFWDGKDIFLVAYNFKGDLLWNKPFGYFSSQHGAGASPILFRDKVIFYNDMDKDDFKTKQPMPRPATLYALNKGTGDVAWELPREAFRACYTAPFILDQPGTPPQLIVTSTTSIASYNPDNGGQNWDWHWKFKRARLRTIGGSIYLDGMLFACSGDGDGSRYMNAIALNGSGKNAQPKQVWENSKDFPYVPCLLSRGDHLYFVNDLGFAGCFEAKTGKQAWFERIPDATFTASPVLIGDKVYAPSEQGDVYVFAATREAFQPLTKNHLGESIRATPAVANGRLYIRGQHHLFCIGTKYELPAVNNK
jgi:outer membrane protein assembly factor BamB